MRNVCDARFAPCDVAGGCFGAPPSGVHVANRMSMSREVVPRASSVSTGKKRGFLSSCPLRLRRGEGNEPLCGPSPVGGAPLLKCATGEGGGAANTMTQIQDPILDRLGYT